MRRKKKMSIPEINRYRCKHCGITAKRVSNNKWVLSYCDKTNRDVHLMLVKRV